MTGVWPSPADDGGAAHLKPGALLPDLALPASLGDAVNLRARRGSSIVYVYPWTGRPGLSDPPGWDDIPGAHGSTPETEGFRDRYAHFGALGFEVFALSTQSGEHQRELVQRLGVPFAILSDADFAFQRALALPTFEAGGVVFLKRLTLVVEDGRLRHVFYPINPPGAHADEVLAWLRDRGNRT
jgi:peroxiredoxin